MEKKHFEFVYQEYQDVSEMPAEYQSLVYAAKEAVKNAYAPYSNFKVGAAVLLDNDIIVKGNNQENAAYPSGLCAERTAIFAASANYPNAKFKAIAITALPSAFELNKPITPCGACRQALLEYENKQQSPLKIILTGTSGKVWIIASVQDLLPLSFGTEQLFNK